jgi:hypothetical protein
MCMKGNKNHILTFLEWEIEKKKFKLLLNTLIVSVLYKIKKRHFS